MKELKNDLKSKNIRGLYLFYGEEAYLKKYYEAALIEAVVTAAADMNTSFFAEKGAAVAAIIDMAETMPFLSERRILIIRNSGLFESGRKEDSERITDFFPNIPDTACLVFIEDVVDKRLKTFKALSKSGLAVDFKVPSESELAIWVHKIIKKEKMAINEDAVPYLIKCCGWKMDSILLELQKLFAFKKENESITVEDIDLITTKTLESRIFDLVDAIGNKKAANALTVYHNLLLLKEHPIMILTMITRQFRLIYQAKYLQQRGFSINQVIDAMGQRSFIVKECLEESKNFTMDGIKQALNDCLSTDVSIKSGKIEASLGVEVLIADYSKR